VLHIAQVAVDPSRRREGLARRMVELVCAAAAGAGAKELTLVVDGRNLAARSLYDQMGFVLRGTLLLASRARIARVNSLQPTGAAQAS
jgi:ribosomal protein S18 acetylase RimI-like enzyme